MPVLPPVTMPQVGTAALLLIFIYGGYEVVPVPAGEAVNPRRDLPFAMVATVLVSMTVMTLAQVVSQGVLVDVAATKTPLADAASVFLGAGGALLIGVGSVISMSGNNAGQVLHGSRMLFWLAEQRQLPAFFGGRLQEGPGIVMRSAASMEISCEGEISFHVDGEPRTGPNRITMQTRRGALLVKVSA